MKRLCKKSFENIGNNTLNFPSEGTPSFPSKSLRWGLGICTAIYIVLFPILLCGAFVCSMLAFESESETPFTMGLITFFMSCLPLSIPSSIYLMWSRYNRRELDKALIFAGLPFYTLGAVLLIASIMETFTS